MQVYRLGTISPRLSCTRVATASRTGVRDAPGSSSADRDTCRPLARTALRLASVGSCHGVVARTASRLMGERCGWEVRRPQGRCRWVPVQLGRQQRGGDRVIGVVHVEGVRDVGYRVREVQRADCARCRRDRLSCGDDRGNAPAPVFGAGASFLLALTPQVEQEPGHGHEQARDPQPGHLTPGLGLTVFRHRTHLQCQRRRTREAKSQGVRTWASPRTLEPERSRLGDAIPSSAFHSESNRSPSPFQRWWASTLPSGRYPAVMRPTPPA
jgi:hypothetical protein